MDFDISPGSFMGMIFFSLIGFIYIKRGKEDGPMSHVIYGIALLIYPYFITGLLPMMLIGFGILALAYFVSFG